MPRWTVIAIAAVATIAIAAGAALWLLQRPPEPLLSFCIAREQCGYIDTDGHVVIAPRFEAAGDWVRDAGRVWSGGLVGSIDRSGTIITPPQYRSFAINAGGSYSVPVGDKQRLTDHALRPINPELWDDFKGIKLDRRLRVDPEYIAAERDGLFALLDGKGRVIVAPRYEDIGWRAHQFPLLVKEGGLFGHIAENGTPISTARWSEAGMFYNNLASVTRDGKCGYIGTSGTVAIPLAFDECRNFWTADAAIVQRGNVFALIDRSGRILRDGLEEVAIPAEDGNPIAVRAGGKWGAVDSKGNYRIEPTFDALEPLDTFGMLLPIVPVARTTIAYRAKRGGKVGLIGLDGTLDPAAGLRRDRQRLQRRRQARGVPRRRQTRLRRPGNPQGNAGHLGSGPRQATRRPHSGADRPPLGLCRPRRQHRHRPTLRRGARIRRRLGCRCGGRSLAPHRQPWRPDHPARLPERIRVHGRTSAASSCSSRAAG